MQSSNTTYAPMKQTDLAIGLMWQGVVAREWIGHGA
jgi:hypothetical protein